MVELNNINEETISFLPTSSVCFEAEKVSWSASELHKHLQTSEIYKNCIHSSSFLRHHSRILGLFHIIGMKALKSLEIIKDHIWGLSKSGPKDHFWTVPKVVF